MADQDQIKAAVRVEPDEIVTGAIAGGTQVIAHDGYDVQAFDEAATGFPRLKRTLSAARQQISTGPALVRDLYWSFHKAAPRIAPPAQLTPAYEINEQIIAEVMSTSEWRELREIGTVGDQFSSAMATIGASEKAVAALSAQTIDQVNRLEELAAEAGKLFSQATSLEDLASVTKPRKAASLRAKAEKSRNAAVDKQRAADQIKQELEATREERERTVRQATRRGLAEALGEIEQTSQAIKAFAGGYELGFGTGSGGPGKMNTLSTREKLVIARQVNKSPTLRMLAAICGRFTRIALQQQKTRVKHPPDEITSITMGSDIARLLPSEVSLLTTPELEDIFYLKFAEANLMQYDLIGHEPEGQGPIIIALDESDSMSSGCDGLTREVWSKAVMLALLSIARLQRRDFAVIHFSGAKDLKVSFLPKGEATHAEVIACASFFYGGGTVFEPWMNKALELVDGSQFEKADVICISDGVTSVSQPAQAAWKKRRAERGMRAYSVLIGTDQGEALLNEISDAVFCLSDLRDDLPALETIFSI